MHSAQYRRWAAWLLAAVCAAAPARAFAYRTLRDDVSLNVSNVPTGGQPLDWQLYGGALDVSELSSLEEASIAAFDTWAAPSCTTFRGNYRGLTTGAPVHGDGRSTVAVITSGWVDRGLPDGRGATTDVQLVRDEGGVARISEADLYLNFDQHDFALTGVPTDSQLDLRGVLTHEVGHVVGLLHPCEHAMDGVPVCDASFEASVLYPDYLGPSQRTLGPDDVAAICALYAAPSCEPSCANGYACVLGSCVATCPGAACPSNGTCDGGECSDAAVVCGSDAECRGGACSHLGAETGQCVASGAVGAMCLVGSDCTGGLCVNSARLGYALCTTTCLADLECGHGSDCVEVDGTRICAASAPASSSCRVGVGRDTGNALYCACLLCLSLVVVGRRLPRRRFVR